jgi:hypothetical protein
MLSKVMAGRRSHEVERNPKTVSADAVTVTALAGGAEVVGAQPALAVKTGVGGGFAAWATVLHDDGPPFVGRRR